MIYVRHTKVLSNLILVPKQMQNLGHYFSQLDLPHGPNLTEIF